MRRFQITLLLIVTLCCASVSTPANAFFGLFRNDFKDLKWTQVGGNNEFSFYVCNNKIEDKGTYKIALVKEVYLVSRNGLNAGDGYIWTYAFDKKYLRWQTLKVVLYVQGKKDKEQEFEFNESQYKLISPNSIANDIWKDVMAH